MNRQAALITGSSRGIGLSTAIALAREGFAIALNGLPGDERLETAAENVRREGVPMTVAPFDVSDLAAHVPALDRIEEAISPLTTLVNNAGVGVLQRGDLLDVSEESYDHCLTVNAKAMFFMSQAFVKRVIGRSRDKRLVHSIVNVTSANAHAVSITRAEYCASKAAASNISQSFAVRLGHEDIAVYDVQPGLIETNMTTPLIESYKVRAAEGLVLTRRVGQPHEIGKIISSLATGKLPYTTGQVISADGGMLVSRF